MGGCLLEKLEDVKWAVLEVDLTDNPDTNSCIESLRNEAFKIGYEIRGVFESRIEKGLYHLHLNKIQND